MYSYVVAVRFDKGVSVDLRPTWLQRGEAIRISLAGNTRTACNVRLIETSGRILQEKNNSSDSYLWLETAQLKPGIYFIRVTGERIDQVFKIVIQ